MARGGLRRCRSCCCCRSRLKRPVLLLLPMSVVAACVVVGSAVDVVGDCLDLVWG